MTPLPPVTNADGRLGLCDVLPGNAPTGTSWAQLAANAGAAINRWEFRWDRIEPTKNSWDFTSDDAAVSSSRGADLAVQGILIGTPGWATAKGQKPGNGVPRGLNLAPSDPKNLWADYVRATVTHYRNDVRVWEIWNEPDLSFFWMGTPNNYYRMLVVAGTVIHSIDPGATVLMGGMVDPGMGFVKNVLANVKGGSAPFDGAAWHAYGNARSVYGNILNFRALLTQHRLGSLPVWVNEAGFPASNPNGEQRQAAFVMQTIAYAFAAGASKVLIYRASDDPLPKTYGLVAANGQPRMGYVAFQVAASTLTHIQAMTYLPGTKVERFAFYEGKRLVTLMWNHGQPDAQVQMTSSGPTAQVVDWQGYPQTVAAVGGVLKLTLPAASYNIGADASNSVVGGPPVLVVQDNTTPPGLTTSGYLASVAGRNRQLALLNHGAQPVIVRVSAASNPRMHQVLTVQPGALQTLDLDLFAGIRYNGGYTLASSAPVIAAAGSSKVAVAASTADRSWFVASASGPVSITNPATSGVSVTVTGYNTSTKKTFSSHISVPAGENVSWSPPPKSALVLKAGIPVVVSGSSATAGLNPSWYAIQPPTKHVALFNPQKSVASVDVRFVGSQTVTGQQLNLSPHHTYSLNTHNAQAVVISATKSIAAGYRTGATTQIASNPGTDAVVASAGPQTNVAMFNPSSSPAHVNYTVVSRGTSSGSSTLKSLVVPAGAVKSVQARNAGDAPRGVVVQSDVPVVAEPAQ